MFNREWISVVQDLGPTVGCSECVDEMWGSIKRGGFLH